MLFHRCELWQSVHCSVDSMAERDSQASVHDLFNAFAINWKDGERAIHIIAFGFFDNAAYVSKTASVLCPATSSEKPVSFPVVS